MARTTFSGPVKSDNGVILGQFATTALAGLDVTKYPVGTLVYDSTKNELAIRVAVAGAAADWKTVSSTAN